MSSGSGRHEQPGGAARRSTLRAADPNARKREPRPCGGTRRVGIAGFQGIGIQVGQTIASALTGTPVGQALRSARSATDRTVRQAGYPKQSRHRGAPHVHHPRRTRAGAPRCRCSPPSVGMPLLRMIVPLLGQAQAAPSCAVEHQRPDLDALARRDVGGSGRVHAWLHRIEGDGPNAAYWYRRAGKAAAEGGTDAEGEAIARVLAAR